MCVVYGACRFVAGAIVAVFVLAMISTGTASAQKPHSPSVAEFLANPTQLLQQFPIGGTLLAITVQQLVLADTSTFKVLLDLLADANLDQRGAIGGGLAQAAKIEVLTDQALAENWQNQMAAISDPSFQAAATNAFADVQLGAVGGGPLGGGGGGQTSPLGQLTTGSGPLQDLRSRPFPTPSFTYKSSVSGASGPPSASRSVSP